MLQFSGTEHCVIQFFSFHTMDGNTANIKYYWLCVHRSKQYSGFSPYIGKKTSLATYFYCTCDVERVLLVLLGSFYVKIFSK